MKDSIFFKDKTDTLTGPFTERQVQEWYRKRWFESSFPFYFTQNDEVPTDLEINGKTLDSLRSRNGIGCPFINFDVKEKSEFEKNRVDREQKLTRIEKEIASLQAKCDAILTLEKNIDLMERRVEALATTHVKEDTHKSEKNSASEVAPLKKPEQSIEEIGNAVASYVLDAFAVYASGEFDSWEKERSATIDSALVRVKSKETMKICERILVEKMKEKDFFFCDLCEDVLFNYKHALIHFTSIDHCTKETHDVINSGVTQVRRVLSAFTPLPAELAEKDRKNEIDRFRKYGAVNTRHANVFRPIGAFIRKWFASYGHLMRLDAAAHDRGHTHLSPLAQTEMVMGKVKSSAGRTAFAELHEYLGTAPTWCIGCGVNTGDREGFYAHHISYVHSQKMAKALSSRSESCRHDALTIFVSMHRKDLI